MVVPQHFRHLSKLEKTTRLTNAKRAVIDKKHSLRSASRLFHIPWSTFRLNYHNPLPSAIRPGHPKDLTDEDEQIVADFAIEYAQNRTPLSRESLKDLIQHCCQALPLPRQQAIPFKIL